MRVRVLFFGWAHDVAGFAEECVDVPEGECLQHLIRHYAQRFPRLQDLPLRAAVNQEMADPSYRLHEGDEVAFLPPVSGGSADNGSEGCRLCLLTREPIHPAEFVERLKAPADGAVVTFEGIVRDHSRGKRTLYLEYEAYEPMALRTMQQIGSEVKQRFAIDAIGIVHRLGRLRIGETSVLIAVTAAHRRAAFEACHYAIDRLKQMVPIWKKEYFEDGAVWAESEEQAEVSPPQAAPSRSL